MPSWVGVTVTPPDPETYPLRAASVSAHVSAFLQVAGPPLFPLKLVGRLTTPANAEASAVRWIRRLLFQSHARSITRADMRSSTTKMPEKITST